MAIVGAAVRLVKTLVVEAAIRQVTVFVTAVLQVMNMSLPLMDVVVPPVVPLIILHVVSLKRIGKILATVANAIITISTIFDM